MNTTTTTATTTAGYHLDGTMLEICSCAVSCPCFIGEDPDGGECFGLIAFHLERGEARGVDVSGLTLVNVAHIPGNALAGGWRSVLLIDGMAPLAALMLYEKVGRHGARLVRPVGAALMLYEKVGRHGARLVRPVGAALILLGLLVMVGPAGWPDPMAPHALH